MSVVSAVCCQEDVLRRADHSSRSLTDCGVNECDREASAPWSPRPTRLSSHEKIKCVYCYRTLT